MNGDYINLLGFITASITVVSFLPQVVKVYKTKKSRDISLSMYVVLAIASVMWVTYGYFRHDLVVMATNSVILTLTLSIVVLKLKYDFSKK